MNIQQLCSKYNIKMSKSLGQNFLTNDDVLDTIAQAAQLTGEDVILEIGPGLGVLTRKLAPRAKKVLAVDIDKRLADIARKELQSFRNLRIVNTDIMELSNQDVVDKLYDRKDAFGAYKVVANIPYSITSQILRKFSSESPRPDMMVLLVQKEVAQRVAAKPGKLSVLGISVQLYGEVEYIETVPARDFYPAPEVDSAIIRVVAHNKYKKLFIEQAITEKQFFRIVKFGFSAKRKKLYNNLAAGLHIDGGEAKLLLTTVGIAQDVRAQELTIEDWIKLTAQIEKG